ncbi:WD repeat-containing protein 18 [Ambystoma mexicanum]|uniref:WD repeat-containing protein 18 n=1 Tax=Ambystoma mexicanum TaxID=8296 RepID=UPI0037E832F3
MLAPPAPELALSSDSGLPQSGCAAWELQSGSSLGTFRGAGSGPRALALLGGDYLLGAQPGKNYINVWELRRPDQLQHKIVCPGPVTCLAASPNGLYLAAGIADSIYMWEVSSGSLLAILSRHYQDLTCICFTDDSSHFLSGAKDSLVLVWSLYSVLNTDQSQLSEPIHVWARHTLPITDLHCGSGGALARAATSSLDQTAKFWSIASGDLLMSILFDVRIMAVSLDATEYHMFCGGSDGSVFQVDLCARPLQRDKSFQTEKESGKIFKGHRNQVTCLSVSMDGHLLLSGSHDETVRLWDIQSKQCLRTVAHKGPVTNALIIPAPSNMFSTDGRPSVPLPRFSKHLQGAESSDEQGNGGVTLRLGLHHQGAAESYLQKTDRLHSLICDTLDKNDTGDSEQLKVRVTELEDEVSTLRKINKDLFDFSARIITKH